MNQMGKLLEEDCNWKMKIMMILKELREKKKCMHKNYKNKCCKEKLKKGIK